MYEMIESERFETMQRMAKAMVSSGYFSDVKDVAQAIVKIQAGSELGIPPFAALTGIHIIKNKPVLGANLIATLVKNDPRYDYQVGEISDDACEIHFFEHDEFVGESRFTLDDAKAAGLLNNPTWKKYPRNMLFARALSNGARWYTPGVFGGAAVYTPDEMDADIDEDGYIIDVTPEQPTEEPQPAPEPEAPEPNVDHKFWHTVKQRIPYFNAPKHAERAAGLLGLSYPQTKDEAAAALMVLEQYACLRADGVEQDEAVFQTMGGSADEEE